MAFYEFAPIFFQTAAHFLKAFFIHDGGGTGGAFGLQGLLPMSEFARPERFEHGLGETFCFVLKNFGIFRGKNLEGGNSFRKRLFFCRAADAACGHNDKQRCQKVHIQLVHILNLSMEQTPIIYHTF